MATLDLRQNVLDYINNKADSRFLRLVNALAKTYQEEESSEYQEISAENKKELNNRLESYKNNPNDLLEWENVKRDW
jgi:2-oxoglutarate dehydrogenase complex dehydrogenase (E1) component-like enzyme